MVNFDKEQTIMLTPDQLESFRKEFIHHKTKPSDDVNAECSSASKPINNSFIQFVNKINMNSLIKKRYFTAGIVVFILLISVLLYYHALIEKKSAMNEKLKYHYNMGNKLYYDRQWTDAIQQFNEIIKISPEYLHSENLIQQSKYERLNFSIISESNRLMTSDNYEQAIQKLKLIKQDSVYYNEAIEQIQFAQDEIKRITYLKQKANVIFEQALTEYVSGQIESSILHLNELLQLKLPDNTLIKDKAKRLKQKIMIVKKKYEEGYDRFRNKQYQNAFQSWSAIFAIDREIVDNKMSYYTNQIGRHLSEFYYIQASLAYDKGAYSDAYMKCNKVLQSWPDHHGCIEINHKILPKINQQ
ncbi:MAG: hypothetical protein HQK75_13750 [Candidatus Magnetomorum sp.]|nr:hypothetical protein [Candidatus Magnetomorum sp.]